MGLHILIVVFWAIWFARLLQNFVDDGLEDYPIWRQVIVVLILFFGTPIFFVEEMLEIIIDFVLPGEEE